MFHKAAPRRPRLIAAIICANLSPAAVPAWAAAPILYHQAHHETPVAGEPDDLLLIPGYGFHADDRVVYEAVEGVEGPTHPRDPPQQTTATRGVADVASSAGIPYSLTIRLPKVMRADQAYRLWVVTAANEWSGWVQINEPRPLWFSPAFMYSSVSFASLPRNIKVIGRNLETTPGAVTQVRLLGPRELTLTAERAPADAAALERYVALARLPDKLEPGSYRVQVRRGESGWIEVAEQQLQIRPDPVRQSEFKVDDAEYGGCKANDDQDDVTCVQRAIAAAKAAGGGAVIFGPGTWNLSDLTLPQPDGILVPEGVSLRGAGKLSTTLLQNTDAKNIAAKAVFTLLGGNVVEGITFRDAHVYSNASASATVFKLGAQSGEDAHKAGYPDSVDDVIITRNAFDRPNIAISDSGLPISRLFITDNEFGAFRGAIELPGKRFMVNTRFDVRDSVIAGNVFRPGSYLDIKIRQGTLASEIGASTRVDFSRNTADGAATGELYSPADPRGWRAAFFWLLNGNQEMLLVSQNTATCTGDKAGDGEAISYDNNGNTFALARAGTAVTAGADSITVRSPLAARQNDRNVRVGDYYNGHWIQVGEGPGLGQVRKIRSYHEDPASGTVTFRVVPNWDVVPVAGKTRISVGREFWQVYTVANTVDHRQPLCRKSNRTDQKGGGIVMWAQNADSAIEANRQYDSDGILFHQYYNADEESCTECHAGTFFADFLEIRGNLIDGEYAWADDCSSSGIFGSIAAGPTPHSPPPTVSYGLSISHNTIIGADGRQGGAISMMPTWRQGPPPNRWPLVDSALIFHNAMLGLDSAPAKACASPSAHARTAISLAASALVSNSVLYSNSCIGARRPLDIREDSAVRVCPEDAAPSCECASR